MGNDDVSSIQQPLAASFSLEAMHMHLQSGWHISLAQHCTWVCMQCRYVCTHAWCSMTLLCCILQTCNQRFSRCSYKLQSLTSLISTCMAGCAGLRSARHSYLFHTDHLDSGIHIKHSQYRQ